MDAEFDPSFAEIVDLTEVTRMDLSGDAIRGSAKERFFSEWQGYDWHTEPRPNPESRWLSQESSRNS